MIFDFSNMFTWIDLVVCLIVVVYIVDGYRQGFIKQLFDVIGIIVSFLIAVKFYAVVGTILSSWGVAANINKPIGFFVLWALVQVIFYIVGYFMFRYLPDQMHYSSINKSFGLLVGCFKGVMIVSIFLILTLVLPFSNAAKSKLSNSYVTGHLIRTTAKIETQVNTALWQMNNNLGFIGIVPKNGENDLGFKTSNFQTDESAEQAMINQINQYRAKAGLAPVKENILLRNVARAHSSDMAIKGYFSHQDLQGGMPSDRLTLAGAQFTIAGENLAVAPTVDLAMVGLINSPEHRENILNPNFHQVGVGVLNMGEYGRMFTQEFTD